MRDRTCINSILDCWIRNASNSIVIAMTKNQSTLKLPHTAALRSGGGVYLYGELLLVRPTGFTRDDEKASFPSALLLTVRAQLGALRISPAWELISNTEFRPRPQTPNLHFNKIP